MDEPRPEPPDDNVETPSQVTRRERRERQQNSRRVYLDPSSPQIGSIARVVIITLVLLFFAGWLQTIITSLTFLFFLLVISIFFAYLIDPLVKLIRRPFKSRGIDRWMPRSIAIPIAYLVVFTIVGGIIAGIAPQVSDQAREFGTNLPAVARSIDTRFDDIQDRFSRLRMPADLRAEINKRVSDLGAEITGRIGNLLIAVLSYLPWFILVPILAFFILRDVNQFRLMVLRAFPVGRWRMRAELVMTDVNTTLAAYMRAQLISCVLIAILCTVGFYAIGLKYALLLGILAGIFEFVPMLGPAAIGIIVTLTAAASDRPQNAIYVAIFLIVLRIVQDYVLYPRIIQGGIHLHPLAIILSVLAGEQVAGIPGVFISIPIVAIITVIYRHVLEHRGTPRGLVSDFIAEAESRPEEAV
jgi:predicted PurR-regulated permease PerM